MGEHVCNLKASWPIGHPLPAVNPDKLTGPEVGEYVLYHDRYAERAGRPAEVVVKVLERSYVWSPGECRSKGGYRRYDWSVVERGPAGLGRVVVSDMDLSPLPKSARVIYSLKGDE